MNHQELLNTWLNALEIQHHSAHTLKAYARDVEDFLNFCETRRLSVVEIEKSDLREYIGYKVSYDQLSSSSIQRMLSAIRQFMKWSMHAGYVTHSTVDDFQLKRQPRALPGMVDIETIQQLLDQPAPSSPADQLLWHRDKAMLELLYSSGLRLSELQQLDIAMIDFERQLLRITGKGNKTRVVPFGLAAKNALQHWLSVLPQWGIVISPEQAVCVTKQGNRLTTRQIENRVKFQAKRAGIAVDLHPHLLRHCFASHLLSNSGDLRAVQEMLGHSNLTTTQIYTHVDFDHLAKIYDQAHPRAQK